MIDELTATMQEKMQKSIAVFSKELASMRAGRATPSLLDKIQVDYYGTMSPINAVANVTIPEARMIQIAPWETRMLTVIEKAIQKSDLGINPSNDGKVIRLVLPEMTEERRKDLVKQTHKMGEECKVALRSIRRDAMEQVKKQQKDSVITEDDRKDLENEIQKITDNEIKNVDKVIADKEKELMSV
ncbi:MAG: ribosome recycling factor [Clostridia bacterium]|nr:ribosome recycling factor [Clostridia bacterium]